MSPQVEAAVIAGVVSLISLGGTALVAFLGFRTTKSVTETTVRAGHKQLKKTLTEQHLRTLNERFATAAEELGGDKPPAVRLAGVYAMAGLADDWKANRQVCIDVLCGYLRINSTQLSLEEGQETQRGLQADREVRHALIRVIAAHLRDGAAVSWQGKDFDLTGVVFDGGDFSRARFSGGTVSFASATFSSGTVKFDDARFSGGTVKFDDAEFSGGTVSFDAAEFHDSEVHFRRAAFCGGAVKFGDAKCSGGTIDFGNAKFTLSEVDFFGAEFSGGTASFRGAEFHGGEVRFDATFSGGWIDFRRAFFPRTGWESKDILFPGRDETICGVVNFKGARFSGSEVDFRQAIFIGTVDFRGVWDWDVPPQFDSSAQLMLPEESGKAPS